MTADAGRNLGWFGIARLGLVQMALGAIIVLTTSTLNRVIVVELALPATLPGLLVGWHYAVQITRPRWGHGADQGGARSPWILGGITVLALGGILASASAMLFAASVVWGLVAAAIAFTLIGFGVGAAGTNLLALLAAETPPHRKAAAAAIVWIMMIFGFVLTAGVSGQLLDPFTFVRLVEVTAGVAGVAVILAALALWRLEGKARTSVTFHRSSNEVMSASDAGENTRPAKAFGAALQQVWEDGQARRFTVFVFVAMLAYSAQDLILEPFAGLIHGYTPGESTKLAAVQNSGVLVGMLITAVIGTVVGRSRARFMRTWTVVGCLASALALLTLSLGAMSGAGFPLRPSVFALGVANGAFAVAAIGSMMTLASAGPSRQEGIRMGVWGASQAIAFGVGGLAGAIAIDVVRRLTGDVGMSFALVFFAEAILFAAAGYLAVRVGRTAADDLRLPAVPAGEH